MVVDNSKLAAEHGIPNIPFYAFISTKNEEELWRDSIISYTKASGGKHFLLDADHYIHLDYPEFIAEKSKEIIE